MRLRAPRGEEVRPSGARCAQRTVRTTRTPGRYFVVARGRGGELTKVDGTTRELGAGARVGFRPAGAGRVIAVAGGLEHDLGHLPSGTRYVAWCREDPANPNDLRAALGEAAVAVAKATAVAGLVVLVVVLNLSDDCDDDDYEWE